MEMNAGVGDARSGGVCTVSRACEHGSSDGEPAGCDTTNGRGGSGQQGKEQGKINGTYSYFIGALSRVQDLSVEAGDDEQELEAGSHGEQTGRESKHEGQAKN